MSRIAIMTDSNSGIMPAEASNYGIHVLPMPIIIDGTTYFEGIDITVEEFYQKQTSGSVITTSQPSPGDVTGMWDRLLQTHDEIVFIPMSSGLSNTCQTALLLADEEPYKDRVFVADNHRISVTQALSVLDAKSLAEKGLTAREIRDILEEEAMDATIYIDRGNTFKVYKDGSSKAYYNPNQVNVTKGGSTGVGINLGGVANVLGIGGAIGTLAGATTVGGASQNAVTTSYAQERILAIPPHAAANLTEYKEAHVKGKQYKTISYGESWNLLKFKNMTIKKGECIHYDEADSPYWNKYSITYSTRADFSVYSTISFGVYIRYVIGKQLITWSYSRKNLLNHIQKSVPDFIPLTSKKFSAPSTAFFSSSVCAALLNIPITVLSIGLSNSS